MKELISIDYVSRHPWTGLFVGTTVGWVLFLTDGADSWAHTWSEVWKWVEDALQGVRGMMRLKMLPLFLD